MILLNLIGSLNRLTEWIKEIRMSFYIMAAAIALIRITLLWMNARDKREALSETIAWMVGIIVGILGLELIEEIINLLR